MCGMDLLAPGRTLPQEVSIVATESTTQTSLEWPTTPDNCTFKTCSRVSPSLALPGCPWPMPSTSRVLDQTSFAQHRSPPLGSLCLGPPSS